VFKLELMKMGPDHSYLCLIPPEPPVSDNPSHLEDSSEETTLIQSWNLLQALSGKCLYVSFLRFAFVPLFALNDVLSPFSTDKAGLHIPIATIPTFANSEKRYIRTLTLSVSPSPFTRSSVPLLNSYYPLPPPGYKPEEDTEVCPLPFPTRAVIFNHIYLTQWEAYTLGQAPATTPESGADLTVAEQNALAVNLELARGAGSRYLIQRWGDGTMCDKTGREREIEIQVPRSPPPVEWMRLTR